MKRLTPGTVTIGVFAILFGLAAAYAARRYLDVPVEVAQPAPPPKTADLVFTRINLPKYSRVRDQDLEIRQVPIDRVPEGALTSKSRALFRTVKSTIIADQPLMEASLYGVGEVPRLADGLPSGHRAVTLSVSAASALNGMIQPDSRVDITLTVAGDHPDLNGKATMTVMRSVLVMATSETRFPYGIDRPNKLRNITVAVLPEDANRLILAQQYGDLSVVLCGPANDIQTVAANADDGRNLVNRDILLGLSPVPVPAPPVVIEKKAEVWRGGKKVELTFRAGEILESVNATAVAEGREPMQALPVSTQKTSEAGGKKPCTNCDKKKKAKEAADAAKAAASAEAVKNIEAAEKAARGGVPTRPISTPRKLPTMAPGAAGQVLEVQVEADQTGPGK